MGIYVKQWSIKALESVVQDNGLTDIKFDNNESFGLMSKVDADSICANLNVKDSNRVYVVYNTKSI